MSDTRENFEAWAKTNERLIRIGITWLEDYGCYEKLAVQTAYEGYQAATSEKDKEIAELNARIAELVEALSDAGNFMVEQADSTKRHPYETHVNCQKLRVKASELQALTKAKQVKP